MSTLTENVIAKRADAVKVGDEVVCRDGALLTVRHVEKVNGKFTFYMNTLSTSTITSRAFQAHQLIRIFSPS